LSGEPTRKPTVFRIDVDCGDIVAPAVIASSDIFVGQHVSASRNMPLLGSALTILAGFMATPGIL